MNTITPPDTCFDVAMKHDGVTTAFDVILDELDAVTKEVNSQGSDFMKNGKYTEAKRIIESGQQLQAFREKLSGLRAEWLTGQDASMRERVQLNNIRELSPHHKAQKTGLSVMLPNGREIHHHVAADTFVEVLRELGIERVKALDIRVSRIPLVATQRSDKYSQTKVGPYWIITHSNTEYKKKLLGSIGERLGVHLTVKIVG